MDIFSLDTDVFVLCLRIYPEFSRETFFRDRHRKQTEEILIRPIYLTLGDLNAHSLPGLHSFSGADITRTVLA